MCRKTCRSCVQKQAAFCEQRIQSRPEIFFRGGNYDRNTEKQRLLTMIFGAFAIFLPDIPMYGLFTSPM